METLNSLFNETKLKIYGDVENPIFVINDICEIIEVDKTSNLIREIKKQEKFRAGNLPTLVIPQYQCQKLSIINERGLYEILFRTNSKLSEQFKDQIYYWLKEQRIQQNIQQQQKILQLEQLQKEFEKQKQQLEKEKQEVNQQLQEEKTDNISREYNYRIIQFLDKRDGKLLYVIHFNEKYRRQKIQKVIHNLIGIHTQIPLFF